MEILFLILLPFWSALFFLSFDLSFYNAWYYTSLRTASMTHDTRWMPSMHRCALGQYSSIYDFIHLAPSADTNLIQFFCSIVSRLKKFSSTTLPVPSLPYTIWFVSWSVTTVTYMHLFKTGFIITNLCKMLKTNRRTRL